MSIEQLFLADAGGAAPQRWCEAFPCGLTLTLAQVLERVARLSTEPRLIWMSSAEARWIERLREILRLQPGARVGVLSPMPEEREGLSALNEGARGYTHAYGVPALLREVAVVVEHGGLWVGPELLQRLVGSTHAALERRVANPRAAESAAGALPNAWTALSAREAEVARAVSAGRSNKEVAALMDITERTVKAHLGALFEKLGVRDRLQLVLRLSAFADPGPSSETESTS